MFLLHAMSNDDGVFECAVEETELINAVDTVDAENENHYHESEDPYTVEKTADLVGEFNAIDSIRNGTFNRMVAVAVHCGGNVDAFTAHLDAAEECYIMQTVPAANIKRYASGEKAGKIKTAQYLSKTYQQARSVIVGFLERGFDLQPGMGKSAMEKAIREENQKDTAQEKSAEDKLLALAATVKALLDKCTDRELSKAGFIALID